ncbi:MAG: hypothetical protein EAZ62_02230, partial [Sphingobacteriia bacterium]
GWIQYEYLGPGAAANTGKYRITVRQYLNCNSNSNQRDADVYLGIFNGGSGQFLRSITIPRSSTETPEKTSFDPCLSNPPRVCFIIDVYTTTIDLDLIPAGYTLTVQRCCRISGIVNVAGNSADIGVSYSNTIPGTINGNSYAQNSSPVFTQRDTAIVCFNAPFQFDFAATDADGDRLEYVFCDGLVGGSTQGNNGARPNPPSGPPYESVNYASPLSGAEPMGFEVKINRQTGLITGRAPGTVGDYVVAVCALEFRGGVQIGSTRKEIHITVADCSLTAAELKPTYISCDGFTMNFQNESFAAVSSYAWDFGVKNSTLDTSSLPTPRFTYADTGVYTLKLKVRNAGGCQDSTTAEVRIFPGFVPAMNIMGSCVQNPYLFRDATTTQYGVVNSWRWEFGDPTTSADTTMRKDSSWKFSAPVVTSARLIVGNSKGCIDTVSQIFTVVDKPSLALAFRDTLICNIDTLPLRSLVNSGQVSWRVGNPANAARILNPNTTGPLVFPRDSTKYYVTVTDNGCINTDSVMVNVLPFISVQLPPDTTVCLTDTFRLRPNSQALSYRWTASTGTQVAAEKFPLVQPLQTTVYQVTANLGYCQAQGSVRVRTVEYPRALLGPDTAICLGRRISLPAQMTGSSFAWSPTNATVGANSLLLTVAPSRTTVYRFTVRDTLGCPKPVTDSLVLTVVPPQNIFAGRDTAVLVNQPLQLQATGAGDFVWTPNTGLNDPFVSNPIAILSGTPENITYTVRVTDPLSGCVGQDSIRVKVFVSEPEIFIPTAFTPNGDGKNDVLRPTTVGISVLNQFQVYNRWGRLLYSTTTLGQGWDGNFEGQAQPAGAYVFQAEGRDYTGKKVYRKGSFVLIR